MELFRMNKRNKVVKLFLASLLFSSLLLCIRARVEPAAGTQVEAAAAGPGAGEPISPGDGKDKEEKKGEPKQEASSPQGDEQKEDEDEEEKEKDKAQEPKQEANPPVEEDEEKVEEEEKKKEKEMKEGKSSETEAQEVDEANGERGSKLEVSDKGDGEATQEQGGGNGAPPQEQGGEDKKKAEGGGEEGDGESEESEAEAGGGFNQKKVDEKIDGLCKPAKDPNLCFNSIVAYIANQKFAEEEINPEWILKMQVNVTINQLLTIQTFIRDMLKQRPQDQVLIKCKDAYFNFATELGKASTSGDKVALKMLATDGPDKLNKDCTALADAQPGATTPDIASTLKEVPNKNEPYLANIAHLADPPKQRKLKLKKMMKK